ncbi:hypothetical protein HY251_01095 [bacterium]|nr:hypothetical protein [bacterium]
MRDDVHGMRRKLTGLTILLLALALGPQAMAQEPPKPAQPPVDAGNDDVEYGQVIDPNVPIDADKMLGVWAQRLKILIFVDPQMVGTKIKFIQRDVNLTWGLFKKVLDFHDIVLDEKESNGRWILFAHLRRNLGTKLDPPFPVIEKGGELPKREQFVTAFIQILHGAGNDIFATVRGLLARDTSRTGNILYVRGPEVVIIVDFAPNVEYYTKIIRALDVQAPGQVTRVIQIHNAPSEDIARVVQQLFRPTSGPGGQPAPPGVASFPGGALGQAQPQVIADPRTNKLIVQAYPYQFDEMQKMIDELDIKTPLRTATIHVYKCKNVDAAYLAGKLSELLTGAKGGGAARKPASSKGGGAAPSAPVVLTPQTGPGGQQAKPDFSAIETRIVPEELSNSLLIQADPDKYKQILSLLEGGTPDQQEGLDHARRRVLIEAQVWEISTPTDNMTIGFELAAINNAHRGSFRGSGATDFGLSTVSVDTTNQRITRIPNLTQGVIGVLTKDTFDKLPVIMQAIANLEHSRLVTTPFALTNDNEQAVFKITQNIPYQTSTLSGTGLAQANVQNISVETSLTVTPQVNSEESLTITVAVDLGSVGAQGSAGLPPSTNSRHYDGTVTIPNMKYVVFGGLESEQNGNVEAKVPFLGDIPIIGHLFKQKQWTHSTSKIYIFIRTTVFSEDRQLARIGADLRQKAHVAAERDEWVPPIVDPALVRADRKELQDAVFEVFGTGSGNPFSGQPKDD